MRRQAPFATGRRAAERGDTCVREPRERRALGWRRLELGEGREQLLEEGGGGQVGARLRPIEQVGQSVRERHLAVARGRDLVVEVAC